MLEKIYIEAKTLHTEWLLLLHDNYRILFSNFQIPNMKNSVLSFTFFRQISFFLYGKRRLETVDGIFITKNLTFKNIQSKLNIVSVMIFTFNFDEYNFIQIYEMFWKARNLNCERLLSLNMLIRTLTACFLLKVMLAEFIILQKIKIDCIMIYDVRYYVWNVF